MEHPWEGGKKVYINGQGHMTNMAAMAINRNKRTNGPVNAHLRPEIYTCTNKLVRPEWYNACI